MESIKSQRVSLSALLRKQNFRLASMILFIGLVLGKLVGLIRLRLILHWVGVTPYLDLFFAASAFSDIWINLLVTGILSMVLIPYLQQIKLSGKRLAKHAMEIGLVLTTITVFVGVFLTLVVIFSRGYAVVVLQRIGVSLGRLSVDIQQYLPVFAKVLFASFLSAAMWVFSGVLNFFLQGKKHFVTGAFSVFVYNAAFVVTFIGIKGWVKDPIDHLLFAVLMGAFAVVVTTFLGFVAIEKVSLLDILELTRLGNVVNTLWSATRFIKRTGTRLHEFVYIQLGYLITTLAMALMGAGVLSTFKYAETLRLIAMQVAVYPLLQASFPDIAAAFAAKKVDSDDRESNKDTKGLFNRIIKVAIVILLINAVYVLGTVIVGRLAIRVLFDGGLTDFVLDGIYKFMFSGAVLLLAQSVWAYLKRIMYAADLSSQLPKIEAVMVAVRLGVFILLLKVGITGLRGGMLYIVGISLIYLVLGIYAGVKVSKRAFRIE